MHAAVNRFHWRRSFLDALTLLAQVGARLPFGVPDPVLCGLSAMELYTGSLWSTDVLEVVCSNTRHLAAELFVAGFRWSDRPRQAERGLWHGDLRIGIDFIEAAGAPNLAEQENRLRVPLDLEHSDLLDSSCLKTIGIEDLIVQQVRHWLRDGAPSGEAVTRLQALLGVASEGVCGPLRTGYLRRRLARETHEDVVIDLMPSGDGRPQSVAPRTLSLTEMQARIDVWRDRQGLSAHPLNAKDSGRLHHTSGRSGFCNDRPARNDQPGGSAAKILPFDTGILIPPG